MSLFYLKTCTPVKGTPEAPLDFCGCGIRLVVSCVDFQGFPSRLLAGEVRLHGELSYPSLPTENA